MVGATKHVCKIRTGSSRPDVVILYADDENLAIQYAKQLLLHTPNKPAFFIQQIRDKMAVMHQQQQYMLLKDL